MIVDKTLFRDSTEPIDTRVHNLLGQMTLAEKIGQMTQVEKDSISPADVTTYFIGSILSGGGGNPSPNNIQEWRKMVVAFMNASLQTRLGIPMIYGTDAVHGHSNMVGATIFPHNVGLGATRDVDLVERVAHATAQEVLATNVHWNFAPSVSVPQDIRWGRTYEGFSENSQLVSKLGAAYVRGSQQKNVNSEWVLASVKHFAGDGGTEWDSRVSTGLEGTQNWQAAKLHWRIDQGDTRVDETTLRDVHLAPYKNAIEAGAQNIMVSYSSWNGLKMHAHEYLLTQVLKNEWGFEGFLISDWMALSQLSTDPYESIVLAINAGLDMIMVPFDYKEFIRLLTQAVNNGDVSIDRLNDAVARILQAKFMLGLFEKPITDTAYMDVVRGAEHRALAREAVQKSLTLLKHENDALPLSKTIRIGLAGQAADDIGFACGGWTIEWQGGTGAITPGATLLDGLQAHLPDQVIFTADGVFDEKMDTAIVVVAEKPTAEGEGDASDLTLSADDTALIQRVREQCDKLILVIYSGRPLVITHVVASCDAIVAAWLPGSEADGIADVLVGDVAFQGKLPFTWIESMEQVPLEQVQENGLNPLWEYGYGLSV